MYKKPLPKERRLVLDAGFNSSKKNYLHGLIEVDVTDVKHNLRSERRNGKNVSLTGYVLYCLSREIAADLTFNSYCSWNGVLYVFDEVDILLMIETRVATERMPSPLIIRSANRKTAVQITDEIDHARTNLAVSEGYRFVELYAKLPRPIRRLGYRIAFGHPKLFMSYAGTAAIAAVGMFGYGGGWGLATPVHTTSLTLGGLQRRPALVNSIIQEREFLSLTLSYDHDIIDGAPAARFSNRIRRRIENEHKRILGTT